MDVDMLEEVPILRKLEDSEVVELISGVPCIQYLFLH